MTRPLLVGITGGIGSGKSTVSRLFQILGVPVYNSDDRGKHLMVHHQPLIDQIRKAFGEDSYFGDGTLNRSYLASEVFSNEEKLKLLNSFVHPAVGEDFKSWIATHTDANYLLKETALLFETGIYKELDKSICVMASRSVRAERVVLRDEQRSMQEIENIMDKQLSDGQRRKLSDYLIDNNGDQLLIPQVLKIHDELSNLSGQ
ncbi:dephospho-CoA kinase [Roseivirga sp.]|uniref:dephospho-CoA kinase n=1 Tax=Roseivirga sp. TaxID=1964215 RepID=UPI003B51F24A